MLGLEASVPVSFTSDIVVVVVVIDMVEVRKENGMVTGQGDGRWEMN